MQTIRTIPPIQPARTIPIDPTQHSLAQSLLLHLLPGVLIAVVFFSTVPLARQWQLPPFMAQWFADLIVLVPSVLGYLYYQGYQRNGRLSLEGVVLYRDRLPWWQFAGLVPVILVAAGGLTVLLAIVPVAMIFGFLAFALLGTFAVLAVLIISRRVGEYAFVRPGREILFSRVDNETKYKAKNVIDVPVYRASDAITAQVSTALEGGTLGVTAVALIGAAVSAAWAVNGWWLGRTSDARAE